MLEVKNINKYFPGVQALNNVTCSFKKGDIHALLGENGAGKSTLMKIVCGIYKQNEGSIFLDGKEMHFNDYHDALASGISIVNQEIQLVPTASIAECIMLDKIEKYKNFGMINWKKIYDDSQKQLDIVGLNYSSKTESGLLGAGQKQLVQIAKALSANAKYLIMDEPTSSLSQFEAEKLFGILKRLKEESVCIIFISHKLDEVLSLCNMVTVLRDGFHIDTARCENLTKESIVEMMINRKTNEVYLGKLNIDKTIPALEVKNLNQDGRFEDINFKLYKGEILGFYGLVGSGRTELAKTILGVDPMNSGEIFINGKKVRIKNINNAVHKHKIGYVSENRKEEGLILSFDISQNIGITIWNTIKRICKFGPINISKEHGMAQEMINKLDIKTHGYKQITNTLSGGNQQKVSIAKWLVCDSDILIVDEPTVGVDVGAKQAIHNIIWNLAKEQNKAIILISSDMTEIIKLARRILVFRINKIVAELDKLNNLENYSYEETSKEIGKHLL